MHSIQNSQSRHNIFSKVNHDKTYLKQNVNNSSSSNLPNANASGVIGASSSGAGGIYTPPIQSPAMQRKSSGATQSLFSPNTNANTVAIIASGGVPTAPVKTPTIVVPAGSPNTTAPNTPGAPMDASPLPSIELNVRKRLAANDLAVKIAAKAPVLTPAAKMGRESTGGGGDGGSSKSKANINIFGVDEEEEYANLQIGYVESEYGDDLDDDVRSVASNQSDRLENYKRSRSSINISKIREAPNEDEIDDIDHHHQHQDYDELEEDDEFNEYEISKTDPRQYKSPLDAHKKLMKVSKVKNRLKAIQALSSKKIIPTDEVLNEHKKTRLMIKNATPTLKDTLSDYNTKFDKPTNISSKSNGNHSNNGNKSSSNLLALGNGEDAFDTLDDDEMSDMVPAPRLQSTSNNNNKLTSSNSFLGNLSKSPSFRFLNSLTSGSKSPTSFLAKSFRSLGFSDDGQQGQADDDEKKSSIDGGVSRNSPGDFNQDQGGSYKAPLDSVHKPIISRKLTSVTFNRFADGKKSLSENPATMVRMLDKMQNLHPDNDLTNDQQPHQQQQQQKSAYHIPALSKIEDENNGKLMKRIDSWITKMTFVEAEKKPEPPPPTRKPDITVENVFGLDGLLMKAEIPPDEIIDDEEYDRLLGRTPARASEQKKKNDCADVQENSPLSPLVQKHVQTPMKSPSPSEDGEGNAALGKVSRLRRGLSKRISFSNLNEVKSNEEKTANDTEKEKEKESMTPKLAPYARALTKTAQSFISSFHQYKENREKNTHKAEEDQTKDKNDQDAMISLQTPLKKKPDPSKVFTPISAGPSGSRVGSPSLMSLPYDDENSNVKMIPRPHPLTANSSSPFPAAPQGNSPSQGDFPKKSILKSNTNSPKPAVRKALTVVADNPSPATLPLESVPVVTPSATPKSMANFNPAKVVVSADDNLEFEYQYSTNSYVPKGYINHAELGIYDRHSLSPKQSSHQYAGRDREDDEYFSERHLQEIEESTAGFTQPVIYLPPDAYHVPIVQTQSISTTSIGGSGVGTGGKTNVLIYNPNHSSSMRDLTNPLLLNSKSSRDKASLLSSSLEASEGGGGGEIDSAIFDDGDDEAVDEEFYPHLKLPSLDDLHASTVSTTQSSLTKVPRNEHIFKPGVVVTKSSFPQVIHNVVFPENVAAQPHLVHYTAGMYQHVNVNPGNEQDSPLTALTRHHEKLSQQLAARQQSKQSSDGKGSPSTSSVGSQIGPSRSQPITPAMSPTPSTPKAAVRTPAIGTTATTTQSAVGMAGSSVISPRAAIPPLNQANLDNLQQKSGLGPRKTSATPSATDEMKKKFMKSNPELLQTASSLDLRDEILHFMKQSGSTMAGQYEQYVDTTCKKPKRHRRDKQGGSGDEELDIDETSTYMSDDVPSQYGDNAMTMTAKMSLNQGFRTPTSQFQAQQANEAGRTMSPSSQQQAYNRLKERLDKRYANDKEGEYHMKQKIKKYLHDGVTEEYKVMRNYIDEIDDWK